MSSDSVCVRGHEPQSHVQEERELWKTQLNGSDSNKVEVIDFKTTGRSTKPRKDTDTHILLVLHSMQSFYLVLRYHFVSLFKQGIVFKNINHTYIHTLFQKQVYKQMLLLNGRPNIWDMVVLEGVFICVCESARACVMVYELPPVIDFRGGEAAHCLLLCPHTPYNHIPCRAAYIYMGPIKHSL